VQVGDLVKFKNNGMIGLIVKVVTVMPLNQPSVMCMYRVSWADGHVGNRFPEDMEVISASR